MTRCPGTSLGERKLTIDEQIQAALDETESWPRRMPVITYCARLRGHKGACHYKSKRWLTVRTAVRLAVGIAVTSVPFIAWAIAAHLGTGTP